MLQDIRNNASSLAFRVVIFLIVFVLAVFGFQAANFFSVGIGGGLSVNGETIPAGEIEAAVERAARARSLQTGRPADPEQVRPQVIQGLVDQALILQETRRGRIGAPEEVVSEAIRTSPSYRDENGVYDPDRLRFALAQQGISQARFREMVADDVRIDQLFSGLRNGEFLTDAELSDLVRLLEQRRTVAWMTVPLDEEAAALAITEESLRTAYDTEQARFTTPEQLVVDYVLLSRDAIAEGIEVTEEQVRERYEAAKAAFEPQAKRRASHILIDLQPEDDPDTPDVDESTRELDVQMIDTMRRGLLDDIATRVENGESFADLARQYSADPVSARQGGDLGFAPRGAYVPEFEEVLWNLEPGEISEPFETEFGWHIVRLEEERRTTYPTLEEDRPRIERLLRQELAEPLYLDALERLRTLAFESETLQPVADDLGLEVRKSEPFSVDAGTGTFADAELRAVAFEDDVAEAGYNSEPVELGPDRAVVMHLAERLPPRVRAFEEVRDVLRQERVETLALQRARERAAEIVAALDEGAFAADVAARFGLPWERREALAMGSRDVPLPVRETAFALPAPGTDMRAVDTARLDAGAPAVVVVSGVEPGDPALLQDSELDAFRRALELRSTNRSFTALQNSLRLRADVEES